MATLKAKILPIYTKDGYPYAPVEITDERGETTTYYLLMGGLVIKDGAGRVTDRDILRAIEDAQLAQRGLKRIDDASS